jgi:hypothetical protein
MLNEKLCLSDQLDLDKTIKNHFQVTYIYRTKYFFLFKGKRFLMYYAGQHGIDKADYQRLFNRNWRITDTEIEDGYFGSSTFILDSFRNPCFEPVMIVTRIIKTIRGTNCRKRINSAELEEIKKLEKEYPGLVLNRGHGNNFNDFILRNV